MSVIVVKGPETGIFRSSHGSQNPILTENEFPVNQHCYY